MEDTKVYSVTAEGISNEGLAFKIGNQFRVLETDKDAIFFFFFFTIKSPPRIRQNRYLIYERKSL